MSAVIDVALPLFAIILAGWFAGRLKLLGEGATETLNRFVYWVALPPLLFLGMARAPIEEVLHVPFLLTFTLATYILWASGALIGWLVHRESVEVAAMQGMNCSYSNTGYMGIPMFVTAFGDAGLLPATLSTVVMSTISIGTIVIVLEATRSRADQVLKAARDTALALLKNPLVMAPVAGILWSWLDLPKPAPAVTLLSLLGDAASPAALVAIGLFLSTQKLGDELAEIAWITVMKLFWKPLVTWVLAAYVFGLDPFLTASAVILAALPTGALSFVVAQRYDVYVNRTSATILVSTIASVITLSIVLAVYAPRFQ